MSQQPRVQKVLQGGRITIPLEDRKKLKLKEGDFIQARIQGNSFVVTPLDFEVRK